MSDAALPSTGGACPACAGGGAVDLASRSPGFAAGGEARFFAVPTVHCAACISTVERGVAGLAGVRAARVNLTQKRLRVVPEPGAEIEAAVIARLGELGYPADPLDADTLAATEADPAGRKLLLRLGISGFAAMNVMLLSVAVWSGAEGATRDLMHWVSAIIALPTVAFAAQPFFAAAWAGLKARRLVMDTPISLAILLAAGVSLSETMQSGEHAYFDAALSLTFFLLLGRYLDHRSRAAARSAASELAALEVPRAERVMPDGAVQTVPLAALAIGSVVRVRPGMRVPVDGTVATGVSEIDRSLLTGETAPVAIAPGGRVHAGEVNLTGPLDVAVTALGQDTQLHQMAELVRAAEASRNSYVALADRAAKVYAPVVHLLAFVALAAWWSATGDLRLSINIATAVLIITYPCALGLAVPSVMISVSGALFRKGVLLKDGTALERLAGVRHVALDKTGTLTQGTPRLVREGGIDPRALALAGALGAGSAHPLARALHEAAEAEGLERPWLSDVREHPGQGISGLWQGLEVRLGRADWIGAPASDQTTTWLSIAGEDPVPFRFADRMRDGAGQMVRGLSARGMDLTLLSGDGPVPVARVAAELGIDAAEGGLSPAEKAARVAGLRGEGPGQGVLMVGDGLNDTAALAGADVSISPASGMDITRNAADIVLLNPDLSVVPVVHDLARTARRRMLQNFALAAMYNAVAIPIALAGYATPLMAALAMSASSICVSLNALRLGGAR